MNKHNIEYDFYNTLIKGIKVGMVGIGILGFIMGTSFGIFISDKEYFKKTCEQLHNLKQFAKKTTYLMKSNQQGEKNE